MRLIAVLMVFLVIALAGGAPSNEQKWLRRGFPESSTSSRNGNSVRSSIVLPLYGNVYPDGFYFTQLYLGQPPRPYFLDPDTGSDLTWVQCDAPCVHCTKAPHPLYRPTNDLVVCRDPLCASLHSGDYECENLEQCDYEVEYADGGSSLGVLVNDLFSFNVSGGIRASPRISFGCGYDQLPGASSNPLDGVLGLGKGRSSILSQLYNQGYVKRVVGHCLSGRGGGFLFFGDDLYDTSKITWTPMSRDDTSHYAAGSAELNFGGKGVGLKNLLVVFDSGSSYSYLNDKAYLALLSSVKKEIHGKPLTESREDRTLPVCWKGKKPFTSVSEVRKYFKPLGLSFPNGWRSKTHYDIPPEGYLIVSSKGSVCLGILNGTEIGLHYNIVGDISMQDKMVIYDNEKRMIGWSFATCDLPPRHATTYSM